VSVTHRIGALSLNVSFSLSSPWTVLFGPSGSGKTTILRAIAGLVRPDEARIVRYEHGGESVLTNTQTFLPPHRRQVRHAPQRASLFPHLSVAQNVAYGSRQSGDESASSSVAGVMEIFGLESLAAKMPSALSGGERQRVNLARAFAAADCRLMLLDEPFAGLDSVLRDQLLPPMQAWLAERRIPALSVTHDVIEALQLKAEVIRLSDGRVTGQGEASQILATERARLLQQLTSAVQ
jgi:molybdate transport system ATP-binding protein